MRKILLLLAFISFLGMQAFAQRTVTGTVTAADDGSGLPGVSVLAKGTSVRTVTDVNGAYSLNVPSGATVLVFEFMGMETQEVAITGDVVNCVLKSSDIALDDVVVTALGITKERKAVGYAVQEVKADKISKSSNVDVVNSLNGKVAGVQITNSAGVAGGSSFIEIRGSSSITRNNQPLFVIDGVPVVSGGGEGGVDGVAFSGRTSDFNPDDVESISVLKGGAATALYGLRAGNGVVIITTKKGKTGQKLNINFRTSVTMDKISQVQELQSKYGQGINNTYYGPNNANAGRLRSWGPAIEDLSYTTDPSAVIPGGWTMEQYRQYWDPNGYIVLKTDPLANGITPKTYDPYDFFQTGVSYDNSINMSTGNENSTFYLSAANSTNNGIVPNNRYIRNSFKFSGETRLAKGLSAEASVTYTQAKGDRIQQGSNTSGVMLGLTRGTALFDNSFGYQLPDGRQRAYMGTVGFDNPYWIANKIKYTDELNRIISFAGLKYKPLDWLTFTYKAGMDWYVSGYKNYFAIYSNTVPGGRNGVGHSLTKNFNSDFLITISRNITDDISANLILGQNMFESKYITTYAQANGLLVPEWAHMSNSSDARGYEASSHKRTAAVFANLDLSYKNMIYFSGTVRNEWSTTLPVETNSFLYPSVSLGFIFTEIEALKGNSILSFGKLRTSWAKVANDAGLYSTTTNWVRGGWGDGWTTGISFPFAGVNGFTYSNAQGNPAIKPESTQTLEFGTELRFFNNRVSADIGYFIKTNEDLLLSVPVAGSTGSTSIYLNAASMETKGIELAINADIVKTNDLTWNLGVNFSNPETTVLELAPGVSNIFLGGFVGSQIRAVADQPYRTVFANGWVKDANGNLILNDNPTAANYGFPIMSSAMLPLGKVAPKWILGIMNSVQWKGFQLSALLEIKKGGLMWNGTKGALMSYGTLKELENRNDYTTVLDGLYGHLNSAGQIVHYDTDGVTELPGPGGVNTTEVLYNGEYWRRISLGNGFNGPAEDFVEKTDWVRLREISLSYTYMNKIQKIPFKSIEVYFTGRNLFLSTPFTGIDPETSLLGASNAQGLEYFNMPGTKAYTFGLKLNF
jgi:TonB-linked SusC/RagA family outer membrane protein